MSTSGVRAVLDELDAVGGFFAMATDPAQAVDPAWRPLTTLTAPDGPLGDRVDEVAGQLGAPRRVAGSLLGMSLAARFGGLLLGAAVLGVLPDLAHDRLHWRPWAGGPLPLWIEDPAGRPLPGPDDPDTARAAAEELATVHLAPLFAALGRAVSVSPRVLWGNAASSLGGAARVLATERPALRDTTATVGRGMVACPPFAGLGEFVTPTEHPSGIAFVRRTCCLYYRVPGGGFCGDCVLSTRGS